MSSGQSSREKMETAKSLIQQKRYDEARDILRTVNHQMAFDWLDKIDKLDPPIVQEIERDNTQKPQLKKTEDPHNAVLQQPVFYQIICPNCEVSTNQGVVEGATYYQFVCPHCKMSFVSNFVTIRSKRASTFDYEKTLSIRVIEADKSERLIEVSSGYSDFELKAHDKAIFSYYDSAIRVIQNLTIGEFILLKKRRTSSTGGYIRVTLVLFVLFLLLIGFVLLIGTQSF